ncbi:MAG: YheU family protein [Pseudomonadales bacterium]|nr:YheU family protein [Pseudomonadales bacterium]
MTEIPYESLDQEVLLNLLEEIVTRDGTDYGYAEVSTEEKVSEAYSSLKNGSAKLVFNEQTDSCSLCLTEQLKEFSD